MPVEWEADPSASKKSYAAEFSRIPESRAGMCPWSGRCPALKGTRGGPSAEISVRRGPCPRRACELRIGAIYGERFVGPDVLSMPACRQNEFGGRASIPANPNRAD